MSVDRRALSAAGMTTYEHDALERPDGYGAWFVPAQVDLDGDALVWRDSDKTLVRGRSGLLMEFVGLAGGDDDSILTFARRWGVLNICAQHNLPSSHLPDRYAMWLHESHDRCRPAQRLRGPKREPLAAWRSYAAAAAAVLNIAALLNQPRPEQADADLWRPLLSFGETGVVAGLVGGELVKVERSLAPVEEQRSALASVVVQSWLDMGDVRVNYSWDGRRPHFDLGEGSLFGAIGIQLALAVARREGLAICDECGEFFIPGRQARPGEPRRCPKPGCRDRAAKRESARRRRARERGEVV